MADLRHDQIHVWKANLDVCNERFDQLKAMLSADEIERARRYRAELDARRFLVGRGLLRELLGGYASVRQVAHQTPKRPMFQHLRSPASDGI